MIRKYAAVFADMLAVLAFGLALFIACRVFPNNENTDFDYQAIIVAILAGLFTLIVGWNIYQAIDLSRKVSEIDSLREELNRNLKGLQDKIECDQAKILGMLSQSATAIFVSNEKNILKYKMIAHGINAIKIFSMHPENTESKDAINKILKTIIDGLNNSKDIKLGKGTIQELVLKCGQIKDHEKINRFKEFLTLIQEAAEQ
ncbi:MAG: hypothetical protein HDS41_07300 [Bacteroides sp.]|nr:hypothetical protein [Bacteroides sp.]